MSSTTTVLSPPKKQQPLNAFNTPQPPAALKRLFLSAVLRVCEWDYRLSDWREFGSSLGVVQARGRVVGGGAERRRKNKRKEKKQRSYVICGSCGRAAFHWYLWAGINWPLHLTSLPSFFRSRDPRRCMIIQVWDFWIVINFLCVSIPSNIASFSPVCQSF